MMMIFRDSFCCRLCALGSKCDEDGCKSHLRSIIFAHEHIRYAVQCYFLNFRGCHTFRERLTLNSGDSQQQPRLQWRNLTAA